VFGQYNYSMPSRLIARNAGLVLLILLLFPLLACKGTLSNFQVFCWPPEADIDDNNCQFVLKVTVSTTAPRSYFQVSRKIVSLLLYDSDEHQYLDDQLEYMRGGITAEVDWVDFDRISIDLYEETRGENDSESNRSVSLPPPVHLSQLRYVYDEDAKQFQRVAEITYDEF